MVVREGVERDGVSGEGLCAYVIVCACLCCVCVWSGWKEGADGKGGTEECLHVRVSVSIERAERERDTTKGDRAVGWVRFSESISHVDIAADATLRIRAEAEDLKQSEEERRDEHDRT